jgi:hypothetical protein
MRGALSRWISDLPIPPDRDESVNTAGSPDNRAGWIRRRVIHAKPRRRSIS